MNPHKGVRETRRRPMAKPLSSEDASGVSPQPARDTVADTRSSTATLEPPVCDGAITLEEILETVREFGSASLGLVAWEFSLDDSELIGVWDLAVGEGLLRLVGHSQGTGEQMYALATPGR
jgi:hypothetical protein